MPMPNDDEKTPKAAPRDVNGAEVFFLQSAPQEAPTKPLGPPPVKCSDIVLYTMPPATNLGQVGPQDRPAVVLEVNSNGTLELQVFLKPNEAAFGRIQTHMGAVGYASEQTTGCWRFA